MTVCKMSGLAVDVPVSGQTAFRTSCLEIPSFDPEDFFSSFSVKLPTPNRQLLEHTKLQVTDCSTQRTDYRRFYKIHSGTVLLFLFFQKQGNVEHTKLKYSIASHTVCRNANWKMTSTSAVASLWSISPSIDWAAHWSAADPERLRITLWCSFLMV